ncbi:dihydrofolate reductase family protein [Actinomadura sp. 9N407]|uniref:dihydrofolate reductase family protein n=1 Tax=Actinomadura sp. 9N407 TaxID=3375154 RepID=UPI0037A61A82
MTAAREIVAGLFISLDGVVEAPKMGTAVGAMHAEADTLVMGRVTYEAFAAMWPHQTGEPADRINDIRKLVASTSLAEAGWRNTTLIDGDVVESLAALKRQPGKSAGASDRAGHRAAALP